MYIKKQQQNPLFFLFLFKLILAQLFFNGLSINFVRFEQQQQKKKNGARKRKEIANNNNNSEDGRKTSKYPKVMQKK